MWFYAYLATMAGFGMATWFYRHFGIVSVHAVASSYYLFHPRKFSSLYIVTEDLYDYLKDKYRLKAPHYKFCEAMRAFREDAQYTVINRIKRDLLYSRLIPRIFWPYILAGCLIFFPVFEYFLVSAFGSYIVAVIFYATKCFISGFGADLAALYVAEEAYKYKYKGKNIYKTS